MPYNYYFLLNSHAFNTKYKNKTEFILKLISMSFYNYLSHHPLVRGLDLILFWHRKRK